MNRRVGAALAEHISRLPGESAYVLVEGVPIEVADGMAAHWQPTMPPLAVVSQSPERFGERALVVASATGLRNRHADGLVLVLCEGSQVADRQSLRAFYTVAPADLLASAEALNILAQVAPRATWDGPARAVRTAIQAAQPAERPSAMAVADWLDAVAAGGDPLQTLPALGAFADHAQDRVDAARIRENLRLASRRRSDDVIRSAPHGELRSRAERVFKRRPGVTAAAARAAADTFMALLQTGSDQLLSHVQFDEARDILEERSQDLPTRVRVQLDDYRRDHVDDPAIRDLPWQSYRDEAENLRRSENRQQAARELLALDDGERRQVFARETRTKLERLLRDRALVASTPSSPETGFVRAVLAVGGLSRIELLSPDTPREEPQTPRAAARAIAVGCARLRLGALLRSLQESGCHVDAALLHAADDNLSDSVFPEAAARTESGLEGLQFRVVGPEGESVQLDWRPDLDDVATLRATLLFAQQPSLTLGLAPEPALSAFCTEDVPSHREVAPDLFPLARRLQSTALRLLASGMHPATLREWCVAWQESVDIERRNGRSHNAESLMLSGAVTGGDGAVALSALAPPKAEWLAQLFEASWHLLESACHRMDADEPLSATASGVARATASFVPAHLRTGTRDEPLLPTFEARVWGIYGGKTAAAEGSGYAALALDDVITKLIKLQPEAAGHLRCLAIGPGAADLLVQQAVRLLGRRVAGFVLERIEIFCVGTQTDARPRPETLRTADDELGDDQRGLLELRYLDDLGAAQRLVPASAGASAAVHIAVLTGLTEGEGRLRIDTPDVPVPAEDPDVLFAPRVWQRPRQARRTLLAPPTASPVGSRWLALSNAIEDSEWPDQQGLLRVPELRTAALDAGPLLRAVHSLALWVATLDRYTTRDSIEQAMGSDDVAILHQQRRLGGDSPLSLVISQHSGGPTDRAIARSLQGAGIVRERRVAFALGEQIRRVASQGYGVLALEAATTGAGINELVGHVVAFSLLATQTTPWPLPPGCRVLLVSLDDYHHWFPGKRADLLALAIDTRERGLHVAAIEVKARRSDPLIAGQSALDQLRQTLTATRWAAYPVPGSIHSRLWLNRITEAAYAIARESQFRLERQEIEALEAFRLGHGTLEWAGVGLVFGPQLTGDRRDHPYEIAGDRVPIVLHEIALTERLLEEAAGTQLTQLRTVEAVAPPLQGGRIRRRPEAPQSLPELGQGEVVVGVESVGQVEESPSISVSDNMASVVIAEDERPPVTRPSPGDDGPGFVPPILGWDPDTDDELRWHAAGGGPDALRNGHTEIWGSSGMGKTQFTMGLLAQLSHHSGSRFGVADFKNDYHVSGDVDFPRMAAAQFIDLWAEGAPFNPLALEGATDERAVRAAVIELRDVVDVAARSYARMGHRQLDKLRRALEECYRVAAQEGRWPTLRTLDDSLDQDLRAVIGDLTRNDLFRDGPPLGDVVDRNVVFGLSRIPGNGLTTVLAAGFILSALLMRVQSMPPVPNTIRYLAVVDEAHRVADFKAVDTMIREGRSKGLAVVLATQQPNDLADVVATNAATKVCFGLPDAAVATQAAKRLNPDDPGLPEVIRTLDAGEAVVKLGGSAPRLLNVVQAWRDRGRLGLDATDRAG